MSGHLWEGKGRINTVPGGKRQNPQALEKNAPLLSGLFMTLQLGEPCLNGEACLLLNVAGAGRSSACRLVCALKPLFLG